MATSIDPAAMLARLNSFNAADRTAALTRAAADMAAGKFPRPSPSGLVNCHAHTFHSFNSEGWSPARLVWEAALKGVDVIGSTDFDVLDAMEEMFAAGRKLGVRTVVSLETRTFVDSYADREINSPGEPGVLYCMGVGFVRLPNPTAPEGKLFPSLAARSRERNAAIVARVNPVLERIAIDYVRDVLPLTPSGNATERHICAAYDLRARAVFDGDAAGLIGYWAAALGLDEKKTETLLDDPGAFRNAVRSTFMKKGGPGYSRPGNGVFPPVRDFFRMAEAAGAVPCYAWLDGLSTGEADPERLLDDAMEWGARAVNVIPDRNWNIADPGMKTKKCAALAAFVAAARSRNLPILSGTEMNSPGQRFVDDLNQPELAPYADDFRAAAFWLHGHTVLERLAGMGAGSAWARRAFDRDRAAANAFFAEAGRAARPGAVAGQPPAIPRDASPEAILETLRRL